MEKQILIEEMVHEEGWCTGLWHKIRYDTLEQENKINEDALHIEHVCTKCGKKRSGYVHLFVDNSNTDKNS